MHLIGWIFFASLYSINFATDPCSLISKYGIIDLSTVGRSDGYPTFLDVLPSGPLPMYKYSYNPCKPFSEGPGCGNVSLCQVSIDNQNHYTLGTQEDVQWDDGTRTGTAPSIIYKYGQKIAHISLLCVELGQEGFIPFGEGPTNTFTFILRHHCACWNNCSYVPTGTTPITSTKTTTTTEKLTTTEKTTYKTTTTASPATLSTTIPLDTASSSMTAHILLTLVSLLFTLLFC